MALVVLTSFGMPRVGRSKFQNSRGIGINPSPALDSVSEPLPHSPNSQTSFGKSKAVSECQYRLNVPKPPFSLILLSNNSLSMSLSETLLGFGAFFKYARAVERPIRLM